MREKFATQVDTNLLQDLRNLAKEEGRQIQALVDEALIDLINKHHNLKARQHVMNAYHASHASYANLYRKLAR